MPTTTPLPAPGLWTIEQAAAYLGVCDDTARPWLEAVAVRFSKRTVRYRPADVMALVDARVGAPAPTPAPVPEPPALVPSDEPVPAIRRPLRRQQRAA